VKSASTIFLAAFIALSASWAGFVLTPQLQLGQSVPAPATGSNELYPVARPGLAKQGAEVYRSLGCAACHSQHVRQDGVKCEVILTNPGTNVLATLAALGSLNSSLAKPETLAALPKAILTVSDVAAAAPAVKAITGVGAKAEVRISAVGPDIARGWGHRRSVAQDYVYDMPVQPGSLRAGPDLANVGARLPDVKWHLLHLYAPDTALAGSTMPPYRFLFEKRAVKPGLPAVPDAISLAQVSPEPGAAAYELIPSDAARALAAYLTSLRADAPLFEAPLAPVTVAVATTNSPAK
jgi:cbb3-type cytochrome oxidase cytochrome c subunit